jgi:hypothetical protein
MGRAQKERGPGFVPQTRESSPLGAVTMVPPGGCSLVDNKRNTHVGIHFRSRTLSSFLVESALCIMDFNFVISDDSEWNWRRLRFVGLLALIFLRLGAKGICVFFGELAGVVNLPERLIVPHVQNIGGVWKLSSRCQPAQCKCQACFYNLMHAVDNGSPRVIDIKILIQLLSVFQANSFCKFSIAVVIKNFA